MILWHVDYPNPLFPFVLPVVTTRVPDGLCLLRCALCQQLRKSLEGTYWVNIVRLMVSFSPTSSRWCLGKMGVMWKHVSNSFKNK